MNSSSFWGMTSMASTSSERSAPGSSTPSVVSASSSALTTLRASRPRPDARHNLSVEYFTFHKAPLMGQRRGSGLSANCCRYLL